MFEQLILMVFIATMGSLIAYWVLPQNNQWVAAAIGPFVGFSVYTIVIFVCFIGQSLIGYDVHTTLLISLLGLFALMLFARRFEDKTDVDNGILGLSKSFWGMLAGQVVVLTVLAVVVSSYHILQTSTDSHYYIQLAERIALHGLMDVNPIAELNDYPPFWSIFQALSRALALDNLWLIQPVYSYLFVLVSVPLLFGVLRTLIPGVQLHWGVCVLLPLLLVSCPFFVFNIHFVNNHAYMAVHMGMFALLTLYGIQSQRLAFLVLALLVLLPTLLMRHESFAYVLAYCILLLPHCSRPRGKALVLAIGGASLLVFALYYLSLSVMFGMESVRFTFNRLMMIAFIAMVVGTLAVLLSRNDDFFRWLFKMPPARWDLLMGLGLLLCLGLMTVFAFSTTLVSIEVMLINLFDPNVWDHFWSIALALIFIGAMERDVLKHKPVRFLLLMIGTFMLVSLLLSVSRSKPARLGPMDSFNRMMIHILPVVAILMSTIMFNLMVKVRTIKVKNEKSDIVNEK